MSGIGTMAPVARSARRKRLNTVVLAVLAPLALWALVEYAFGFDLRSPAFENGEVADVGAANVVVAALIGSALGWATLELLERLTVSAPKLWLVGALVVLVVSLGGPLGGSGIAAANRAVLAAMHVLVAGVLAVGLYRSAVARRLEWVDTGNASSRRKG